jgi:hypothetical protein
MKKFTVKSNVVSCDQKLIVMDVKKYFKFSHSTFTLTGMDGFWTGDVENTPDAVKYKAVVILAQKFRFGVRSPNLIL